MKLHITESNWKIIVINNIGTCNMGNVYKELYKRSDLHKFIIDDTSFCIQDTNIKTRLIYIVNGITEMNICNECNELINDGAKDTLTIKELKKQNKRI